MKTIGFKLFATGVALALLTACGSSAPPSSSAPALAVQDTAMRDSITSLTNLHRGERGLPILQRNAALDRAAQAHAEDMAWGGFFDHEGSDGGSVMDRIQRAGLDVCLAAENIAYGQRNAFNVMEGWIESPGHRRNIESGRATMIGVGHVPASEGRRAQYVQVFAKPC